MRGSHALALAAGLLAASLASAQPQQNIGIAAAVKDRVTGSLGAQERQLARGDGVFQREVIGTNDTSSSQLLFLDETTLTVGPNSNVTLDEFVYDPRPGASKVTMTIGKGVTRFVTGVLQTNSYEIKTPTATIGVRGTILLIFVGDDGVTSIEVQDGSAVITPVLVRGNARVVEKGGQARIEVDGRFFGSVSREAARAFYLKLAPLMRTTSARDAYFTREEAGGSPLRPEITPDATKNTTRSSRCGAIKTQCVITNPSTGATTCFTQPANSSECFLD
jgi:hypothetical protein